VENEDLQQVEQLLMQAKLEEALEIVERVEKDKEISTEDRLAGQILKSHILTSKGEYEKGLEVAETVLIEIKKQNNLLQWLDAHIAIARALGRLERYSDSLEEIKKAEKLLGGLKDETTVNLTLKQANLLYLRGKNLCLKDDPVPALTPLESANAIYQQNNNKYGLALCLRVIGIVNFKKGNKPRALEYYQESLVLNAELGNKLGMAECLRNISTIYQRRREFDKAIDYLQRSMELAQELNNQSLVARTLLNLGAVYLSTNPDEAQRVFQKAVAINEEFGYQERLAMALMHIGFNNSVLGALDRGLDYLQRAEKICKEIGHQWGKAYSVHMLGWTYQCKGELDLALKCTQQSLRRFQEVKEADVYPWILWPLLNLGIIYQAMGETEAAYENLNHCLTQSMEKGNGFSAAYALYYLIMLTLDGNQIDHAKTYLEKLKDLSRQDLSFDEAQEEFWIPIDIISQFVQISGGLILKKSKLLRDKVKAQEKFGKLLKRKPIMNADITYYALLSMCELQLFEIRASEDEEILKTTKSLVEELSIQVQKQGSYTYLVNTLILQAKLLMIEGDLVTATEVLEQARRTAEKEHLGQLLEKVTIEVQQLKDQYQEWEKRIQANTPIRELLEHAQLKDYLEAAQKLARSGPMKPD
jgi:tetratricopeptide (TPR) repeat protein